MARKSMDDEQFTPYEQCLVDSFDHHEFQIVPESLGYMMHNRSQWDTPQYTLNGLVARKDDVLVHITGMSLFLDDELSATILHSSNGSDFDDFLKVYEDAADADVFLSDFHSRPDELYNAMNTHELTDTARDISRYGGISGTVEDILIDEFYTAEPDYDTALHRFLDDQEYTRIMITEGGTPDGIEKILEVAELPYRDRKHLHDDRHEIEVSAWKYLHI